MEKLERVLDKMKKQVIFFAFLFLVSFVSATTQSYQIFDKSVLVELRIDNTNNLQLEIPKDAKALEVNTNYHLDGNILEIGSGSNVVIKYISEYFIEKTNKGYFFVIKNQIRGSDVSVFLSEGAVLSEEDLVFPQDYKISSDGHRIILNWENLEEENVLVSYEFSEKVNWFFYLIAILVICVLIYFYFVERKKYLEHVRKLKKLQKLEKEKVKEIKEKISTANLFGDEKNIVEFLKNKKEGVWTKEISKALDINKVTLSRKLRNLEQKNLIEKIHYGNADKVFLKK